MRLAKQQLAKAIALALTFTSGSAALLTSPTLSAAENSTQQISWDLSDLYSSPTSWSAEKQKIDAHTAKLQSYQGKLGENANMLAMALDDISATGKQVARLYVYAMLSSDTDLRNAENMERRNLASALSAKYQQAISYVEPELLSLGESKIEGFIQQQPSLSEHAVYLRDVLRRAPYTLGAESEKVMALSSPVSGGPRDIYSLLANSGIEWPSIKLKGEQVTLNQAMYTKYRSDNDRTIRKQVFEDFFAKWADYEAPLGQILDTHVKSHVFNAKARSYDSAVASAMAGANIPVAIYEKLVEATNRNLPSLHRYLELRKRMLGVEQLEYYDMYPALVKSERSFTIDEAKTLTLAALKPLGKTYLNELQHGMAQQWMHVYPQPGKRPGAYMAGSAYDVHPYVLLNFNGGYEDVSTFAHEWGHAVHTMLAKQAQPWETASYSTFTAEIASTTNEILLEEYMESQDISDEEKLYYLGSALESIRGTYFRQTMFAEFELRIHQEVERGAALSGQKLSAIYLELLKKYYGHDKGITHIDDLYGIEWAYIPHFYYNFYVYQYATSISGGALFADKIMQGDSQAAKDFVAVLQAGGSQYPHELLKGYGIDLASDQAYDALAARMEQLMDRIEAILDRS